MAIHFPCPVKVLRMSGIKIVTRLHRLKPNN